MQCRSSPGTQASNPWPRFPMSSNVWWMTSSGRTELGNAFLAQQNDVMDAVQRMREKARKRET